MGGKNLWAHPQSGTNACPAEPSVQKPGEAASFFPLLTAGACQGHRQTAPVCGSVRASSGIKLCGTVREREIKSTSELVPSHASTACTHRFHEWKARARSR